MEKPKSEGYGIASLILGIFSVLFFFSMIFALFGVVCGVLGIIFANKQKNINPNGVATGGLITSIVGTILSGLMLLFFLLMVFASMSYGY